MSPCCQGTSIPPPISRNVGPDGSETSARLIRLSSAQVLLYQRRHSVRDSRVGGNLRLFLCHNTGEVPVPPVKNPEAGLRQDCDKFNSKRASALQKFYKSVRFGVCQARLELRRYCGHKYVISLPIVALENVPALAEGRVVIYGVENRDADSLTIIVFDSQNRPFPGNV